MAVLLVVGIILPLSVLINFESSELPALINRISNEPIELPFWVLFIRTFGQISGIVATIALFLKCLHIGSTFWILKWRFYKKHRGYIMIICAFIQASCSTAILVYFVSKYKNLANEYVTGEYIFFNIQSMILSFLSALLLAKDVRGRHVSYRRFGIKPAQKRLSSIQRQLIILEILVITYLLIGGVLFSRIEKWSFNDSVYYSIITLMTCGTGDFSPQTGLGRLVMITYSIPGVVIAAFTVYSIYSVISEILYSKIYTDFSKYVSNTDSAYVYKEPSEIQDIDQSDIQNIGENILESEEFKNINIMKDDIINNEATNKSIELIDDDIDIIQSSNKDINNNISSKKQQHFSSPLLIPSSPTKEGNNKFQDFINDNEISHKEYNSSMYHFRPLSLKFDNLFNASESDISSNSDSEFDLLLNKENQSTQYQQYNSNNSMYYPSNSFPNTSFSYYRQNSNTFSISSGRPRTLMLARRKTILQQHPTEMKVVAQENIDTNHVIKQTRSIHMQQLKLSLSLVIMLLLVFALLYSWLEKWTFFDSFYFCYVNLATIGYGDIVPVTIYGKSIYMIFIFATVTASTWFGTAIAELATGKWEVYIEKSDMEDEIMKNTENNKIIYDENN